MQYLLTFLIYAMKTIDGKKDSGTKLLNLLNQQCIDDFKNDYNAYKGNAYGLANTLMQTAKFKPSLKHKTLKNFYFTGQLTVPGPGLPPSIISGEVVAKEVLNQINK